MKVKVRHVFQPRQEVEVSHHEAKTLEAQGLLWHGTEADLAALDGPSAAAAVGPPVSVSTPAPAAPAVANTKEK
jgi:hypothetical protein